MTASEIIASLNELRELPTPVSDWLVETGHDSIGEPAVWVYVILEKDDVDFPTRYRLREMVRDAIHALMGPSYWAYVRFRTASEMAELS